MQANLVSAKKARTELEVLASKATQAFYTWRSFYRSFQLGYAELDEVELAEENYSLYNRDYQLARKNSGLPYLLNEEVNNG